MRTEISYTFRSRKPVRQLTVRTERFHNTFFPFCLSQWNKLDCHIKDMPSSASFKRAILKFFRPSQRFVFKCPDRLGVIYLTRLRVGFSHLNEHRFRHNFIDTTDPFCSCRTGAVEDTKHYLLHCPNYAMQRLLLFDDLRNLHVSLFPLSRDALCDVLLFGYPECSSVYNSRVQCAVIKYIMTSGRFDGSIFN